MSISKLRAEISSILVSALVLLASGSATSADSTAPIRVRHSISIRNGNWIPLPVEDMQRAAGDTALARLTDAGRLDLLDVQENGTDVENSGSLALEIALIVPAETAKLTITLDVEGSPTLVSTASISVRALDHAGIYAALEHVGERAADRLAVGSTSKGGRDSASRCPDSRGSGSYFDPDRADGSRRSRWRGNPRVNGERLRQRSATPSARTDGRRTQRRRCR